MSSSIFHGKGAFPGTSQARSARALVTEGPIGQDAVVFVDAEGRALGERSYATGFRETLAALFERTASRQPIRLHDTRATFITIVLASGRT